uniref:Uncharacterized protein n=1 Tax=Glycine max TaxID=3847 RepID=C6T6L4_SOYBN|nr:unknown [Glycine max]
MPGDHDLHNCGKSSRGPCNPYSCDLIAGSSCKQHLYSHHRHHHEHHRHHRCDLQKHWLSDTV